MRHFCGTAFCAPIPSASSAKKTIGNYIADFYCHEAKLVIELDDAQHYEAHAKGYDEERTRFLEAAGLHVLRFPNEAVEQDFAGVCAVIDRETRSFEG